MGQVLAPYIDNRIWCTRALMVKYGFSPREYYGDIKVDDLIREELSKRLSGLNLSLGAGFTNHYDKSVNLDVSFESLGLNDKKGVLHDIDDLGFKENGFVSLPFKSSSFDSATMIGLWPYLDNPDNVFYELHRVIKPRGKVVIVNQNNMAVEQLRVRGNESDEILEQASRLFYRTHMKKVPFNDRTIDFIDLELA